MNITRIAKITNIIYGRQSTAGQIAIPTDEEEMIRKRLRLSRADKQEREKIESWVPKANAGDVFESDSLRVEIYGGG